MLQKVSKESQRALDLADKIESLNEDEFDMGNWEKCICGWLMRSNGHFYPRRSDELHTAAGAKLLGISETDANRLFSNSGRVATRSDAARMLRHLAVTGEVTY